MYAVCCKIISENDVTIRFSGVHSYLSDSIAFA